MRSADEQNEAQAAARRSDQVISQNDRIIELLEQILEAVQRV